MDAIVWLVLALVSIWLAYTVVTGERRGRTWASTTSVGVFMAVFGGTLYGLFTVWEAFFRRKLVDDFASENTLLFVGLLVVAALVVMILDLLGTIDIMSKIQGGTGRPAGPTAPPSGPPPPGPGAD
ncbi:MAG TPA: hypothetical protein VMM78_08800 [Thermomicrobiales bacterium]|nr:hypothetical protein [Thermomicrobiales bacterium]